jgi:hypothetical protein
VTLPPSDAQSSGFLPRRSQLVPPPHSIPPISGQQLPANSPQPMPVPIPVSQTPSFYAPTTPQPEPNEEADYDSVIDFASHSWDLATGGLKTLTAKREFPSLSERRPSGFQPAPPAQGIPRTYALLLIILFCLVLMLVSGGIVLFIMLQS